MKATYPVRFLYLFAVAIVMVGAWYGFSQYNRLSHRQAVSNAAIAASLGRLAKLVLGTEGKDPHQQRHIESGLMIVITQLSLVIVSTEIDVESLDSDAFEGLCTLLVSVDRLFPADSSVLPEAHVYRMLNAKLHSMSARVRGESTMRFLRIGSLHKCALR